MLKLEIIGNIGADAQIQNHNGAEFVSFSVAHTEKIGDKTDTIWVSCTTQNKKIAQYLTKGTKVYVRGNASVKTFKNNQGVTMAAINLFATEIEFCGGAKATDEASATSTQAAQAIAPTPTQVPASTNGDKKDPDLPF